MRKYFLTLTLCFVSTFCMANNTCTSDGNKAAEQAYNWYNPTTVLELTSSTIKLSTKAEIACETWYPVEFTARCEEGRWVGNPKGNKALYSGGC